MLSGGKHKNQPEIPKISESLVRLQGLTKCLTVPLSDNVYIRSGEYHPWVEMGFMSCQKPLIRGLR